jgi:menaquinone-dependent protoporphyrinogen IX oxidase
MKYLRGGKQVMMKETPELEPYQIDLKNHDIIYIGTPVWAFTFTPAIRSFLKHTHLKNKKIVLFCTHEG